MVARLASGSPYTLAPVVKNRRGCPVRPRLGRFVGVETDEVLTLLQEVAEEVINPRFRSLEDDEITEKNPGDLVTVADREAEVLITAALRAAYPDALILGEEATALRRDAGRPLLRGRARVHRRPGRRHQELRQGLEGPRA